MWFVVARSEYLRRVRSRMFLVGTLLIPLLIAAVAAGSGALALAALDPSTRHIGVVDSTGSFSWRFDRSEQLVFLVYSSEADAEKQLLQDRLDAYVVLPENLLDSTAEVRYVGLADAGMLTQQAVRQQVNEGVRSLRLEQAGLSVAEQRALGQTPRWWAVERTARGDERANSATAGAALGFGMGFIIYMVMLLYGQMVMMGVMEEKQHRVLEVMASAVRPFDLLMGKVLGIGAVGLTQLAVWLVALGTLSLFAGSIANLFFDPATMPPLPEGASGEDAMAAAGLAMPTVSIGLLLAFVAYFLGGYLLYASLFAAVGSAVEQQQDAQSLLLPLMMPVILSFAALQAVITNPGGTVSTVLSLVPFFSPILMPARMAATDVPAWEVAASLSLLAAAFVGAIWLSARIYRVGILSYGKKPTLRDLARWVRTA